ncbi:MAG: hypothetical protein OXR82_12455 [Gammaproteobacteria bacterium]|nr:hypothetical protein [Gammaproteobacteria bacterium]MDE0259182.1 hypothetical protein [Gammaproteobacteria bacterium]
MRESASGDSRERNTRQPSREPVLTRRVNKDEKGVLLHGKHLRVKGIASDIQQ